MYMLSGFFFPSELTEEELMEPVPPPQVLPPPIENANLIPIPPDRLRVPVDNIKEGVRNSIEDLLDGGAFGQDYEDVDLPLPIASSDTTDGFGLSNDRILTGAELMRATGEIDELLDPTLWRVPIDHEMIRNNVRRFSIHTIICRVAAGAPTSELIL